MDSSSTDSSVSDQDSFRTVRDGSFEVFDFLLDIFKYVDDTIVVEAVELTEAARHLTTGPAQADCKA